MDKVNMEYIQRVVESEGLEYAVCNYLSAERIEDQALALLWDKASCAMMDVEQYLKAHGGWPEE